MACFKCSNFNSIRSKLVTLALPFIFVCLAPVLNACQDKTQSVQSSADDYSSASTGSTLTSGLYLAIIFNYKVLEFDVS